MTALHSSRGRRGRARRGMALLAALWLVVAIAAVALQFSLAARERRVIGLAASDRGRDRAIASGALATMQARMEYDLRNTPVGRGNTAQLRSTDPWLDADSVYSGTIYVDSTEVYVEARDLGTTLNVNFAPEAELRLLLGFVIGNASMAERLAAAILDWRDADDNPRPGGAERDQYIRDNLMVLPSNGPFRELDDLIHVYGMTPDVLELIRPYLTTRGTAAPRVNLNTAPEPVLRALPRMTDPVLNQILALRSQGRRITSVQQVVSGGNTGRGGGGGRGGTTPQQALQEAMLQTLNQRATVTTTDIELTFYVQDPLRAQPTRLIALMTRAGTNQANVQWQLW